MKQYCRYCSHLFTGNGIWCDAKQKIIPECTAKAVNRCKQFDFNEIDAFFENEKGYKPRGQYKPRKTCVDEVSENQLQMEV